MMKSLYISISLAMLLSACGSHDVKEQDSSLSSDTIASKFQPTGWTAMTLPELSKALANGDVNSEQLVRDYLERIEKIDRAGPQLQSILSINPEAISEAKRLDRMRADGQILGALHGVPILLKDNIESQDNLPTTAGALVLKDNITGRDSPLVSGLRSEGAIILGKTNLSQWANFRSNNSMSGWSALGGQVKNPHMLDRNPCGSSSGSGAAIAASLAAGAVGTETNGSIICPSNVNGIVGFKPSIGLVSQDFIVPISSTQDTAGPMTKTVKGSAIMLGAMATGAAKTDYAAGLDAGSLSSARIGVLRFAQGSNADVITAFNLAVDDVRKLGAEIVEIDDFSTASTFGSNSLTVLKYEFKATLNDYLAATPKTIKQRSLSDIIAFNKANSDVEMALFDQSLFIDSDKHGPLTDEAYKTALTTLLSAARENGIDALMKDNNVDVLMAPSGPVAGRIDPINGDIWPAWAGAGYLAAIAGYPHLSVPMGHVHGVPIGVSFMGAKDQDAQILSYGYAYEQASQKRAEPQYLNSALDRAEIANAMKRK